MAATPPVTSSSELLSAYRTTAAGAKLAELLGQQAGFHRNLNVHPDAKAGSRFALQLRAHHPLPLIICAQERQWYTLRDYRKADNGRYDESW